MSHVSFEALSEGLSPFPGVLFVNAHARRGTVTPAVLRQLFRDARIPLADVISVDKPGRLPDLVRAAIRAGARSILVGGGDGTVSCAAGVLAGTDVSLGVLPLGTGNDFARSIGMPVELEEAVRALRHARTSLVDVGRMNDRVFLNAASLGLTVAVTKKLSVKLKRTAGKLAYPIAAARAASEQKQFGVSLRFDDLRLKLHAVQVVVGNGRFHGAGRLVAYDADIRDGLLDVYVVNPGLPKEERTGKVAALFALLRAGARSRAGSHVEDRDVLHVKTRVLGIEAEPNQPVNLDGEIAGHTPCRFEVLPARLQVLVPAASPH